MPDEGRTEAEATRLAAGLPAKGKLLANLSVVSKEDRARAGITDEMATAMVEAQSPAKEGVQVVHGPWQGHESADVESQVRIIDYDKNLVLWSGTESEYAAIQAAMGGK